MDLRGDTEAAKAGPAGAVATGEFDTARPPVAYVTRTLLLVCVAIEAFAFLAGDAVSRQLVQVGGLIPARISGQVIGLPETLPLWLTFFTHMFLHSGPVHLAMNMVFLAWVGRQVEWLVGAWRFLGLYLAGGVAGGLLQVALTPGTTAPVVGASGAISAVFAAYCLLFAKSGEEPARFFGLRLSGEAVRAFRYASLWIGLQLLTAVAFNTPGGGGIAIWAHIGGFVAGLLVGLPLLRSRGGRN